MGGSSIVFVEECLLEEDVCVRMKSGWWGRRLKYGSGVYDLPGCGGSKGTAEAGADGGPIDVRRIDVGDHAHEEMALCSFIPDDAVSVWLS